MEFTPVVAMEGFKPSNGGVKVLCLHHLATPHYILAFLSGKLKPQWVRIRESDSSYTAYETVQYSSTVIRNMKASLFYYWPC